MAGGISNKIYDRLSLLLAEDNVLGGPILYTLRAKIANNSLASHGIDCYHLSKFVAMTEEQRLNMAAAIELAWTCILMYDDIIDNDTVRYNQTTAWEKYGKKKTEMSIAFGLAAGRTIHLYPEQYTKTYKECVAAQARVQQLPLNAPVKAVEDAYYGYKFGSFGYLLPFDAQTKSGLGQIGYRKMLLAQLLNDYKDTCGSRRISRNYPEIREKQTNYILSLYQETLKGKEAAEFLALLNTANSNQTYEKIAQQLITKKDVVEDKFKELIHAMQKSLETISDPMLKKYMTSETRNLLKTYSKILTEEFSAA